MSNKMKALTIDIEKDGWSRSKGFFLREVERPVLDEKKAPEDAEEVLIKIRYAGVCGSDRGIWKRYSFQEMIESSLKKEGKTTRIIGHEFLGEIVAIGSKAKEKFGYKVGDIVSTESHIICDKCYQCKIGDNHVCAENIIIGISRDGCFAEYIKLPAKSLWKTDINIIRPEIGAIQEPFGNAVHVATKVDVKGKNVAVFGTGTIGLFVVAILKALGAKKIIGIEPSKDNQERAKKLGVDHIVDVPLDRDASEYKHDKRISDDVKRLTGGVGVDVACEMFGSEASVNNAIFSTRRGGDVILFGLRSGDFRIEQFDKMIMDGISLNAVVGRRIFATWDITKRLLEDRKSGLQENIWKNILNEGKDTIIKIKDFEPKDFERRFTEHPKIVIDFT